MPEPEKDEKARDRPQRFQSVSQGDVPRGRDGKHKEIILELLEALSTLSQGSALKVALADLPDSKENVRAALSRATRQRHIEVATSSDDAYLYIWKVDQ